MKVRPWAEWQKLYQLSDSNYTLTLELHNFNTLIIEIDIIGECNSTPYFNTYYKWQHKKSKAQNLETMQNTTVFQSHGDPINIFF